MMLGGLQLFLSTQLSLMDLEISFGPEGFLAVLLPAVLLLCGVLVWVTPQHRFFYSIIGTLTAVYSLLGLNLGGWFIGMLFGIIGGALGFAWTPTTPKPAEVEEEPGEKPAEEPDERPTQELTGPLVDEPPGTDQTAEVRAPWQEPRTYVVAALPLLLAAGLALPPPAAQICLPLIFCPEETPTPTPTPTPSPSPEPTGGPEPEPEPTDPGEEPDPGEEEPDPEEEEQGELPICDPPPDHPLVSAQPALMTADRLDHEDFVFECVTELPTANGPIEVMKFSFSRAAAANFSLTAAGEGADARVTADPLVLAGDVTFYTNRFTGNLLGVAPLDLTPDSLVTDLLELVNLPPLPVFFTNVSLDLVFTEGAQLTATGFLLAVQ
jgi:hypothetical protein